MHQPWLRRMARALTSALACSAALLLAPPLAAAQTSHWGVSASFVPTWDRVPELYELMWDVDDLRPEDGREFRVGVVRGRDDGGDWSVTFVRNSFRTGQVFEDIRGLVFIEDAQGNAEEIVTSRSLITLPGTIEYTGVKWEKFTPFVRIKDRVQIGVSYGIGIGSLEGTALEEVYEADVDYPPPDFRPVIINERTTFNDIDVREGYKLEFVPIGSVELAVAVLVAPGLKVRLSGGFNYPNTQVISFTVNYLIGAR